MPLIKCACGLMRFLIIYVSFMSVFRNFHPSIGVVPHEVFSNEVTSLVDSKGVQRYVMEKRSASALTVPSPSEYNLEMLLRAGVPLTAVNPLVVDNVPSSDVVAANVEKIINTNKDE